MTITVDGRGSGNDSIIRYLLVINRSSLMVNTPFVDSGVCHILTTLWLNGCRSSGNKYWQMAGRLCDSRIKSEGKEDYKVLPCPFFLCYFILFLLYLKVSRSIGKLDFFYCITTAISIDFFLLFLLLRIYFPCIFFQEFFLHFCFGETFLLLLLQFKVLRKMFFLPHYLKSFIAFVREVVHKNRILRAHKQ